MAEFFEFCKTFTTLKKAIEASNEASASFRDCWDFQIFWELILEGISPEEAKDWSQDHVFLSKMILFRTSEEAKDWDWSQDYVLPDFSQSDLRVDQYMGRLFGVQCRISDGTVFTFTFIEEGVEVKIGAWSNHAPSESSFVADMATKGWYPTLGPTDGEAAIASSRQTHTDWEEYDELLPKFEHMGRGWRSAR